MQGQPAGNPGAGYTSPPGGGWVPSAAPKLVKPQAVMWALHLHKCTILFKDRAWGLLWLHRPGLDCSVSVSVTAWREPIYSAVPPLWEYNCNVAPGRPPLEYPATTHRSGGKWNKSGVWDFWILWWILRTFEDKDNSNFSCFDILGHSPSIAFLTKTCLFYIWREDENLEKMRLGLNYTVSVLVPNADFCRPLFL